MSTERLDLRLLLQTLRLRLPGVRVHLRLADDDSDRVVVGLVTAAGTPDPRFYDVALEERDLVTFAPIVAARVVALYQAHEGALVFLASAPPSAPDAPGSAPTVAEPTNPPPVPPATTTSSSSPSGS